MYSRQISALLKHQIVFSVPCWFVSYRAVESSAWAGLSHMGHSHRHRHMITTMTSISTDLSPLSSPHINSQIPVHSSGSSLSYNQAHSLFCSPIKSYYIQDPISEDQTQPNQNNQNANPNLQPRKQHQHRRNAQHPSHGIRGLRLPRRPLRHGKQQQRTPGRHGERRHGVGAGLHGGREYRCAAECGE